MVKNKARFQFEQGLNFFHKEDYSQASTYFEEAVVEDPEYSEALYNLSCCCSMLGDRDKALVYLSRAAKLNPHCLDWAKEDREFTGLREDTVFNRLVSGETEVALSDEPEQEDQPAQESETPDDEFQEAEFEQVESPDSEAGPAGENPEETGDSEPPPMLDDGTKPKIVPVKADLPPCIRCEGLVDLERKSIYDPKLSLAIIYVGVAMSCGLFFSFYGIIGIPVTAVGLYFFSRVEETWVCQNCGSKGAECGQPEKKNEP